MDIFERGPTRGRAKVRVRILLAALVLGLAATALTVIPAGQATFPGANGKIAWNAQVGNFGEIFVMDADGSNKTNLTNNAAHDFNPLFSPDGTKIAFGSLRDGDSDVYVMNADGTAVTQLTNTGTETPTGWSPDGTKILFSSTRDGNAEIYVMNADGSNQTNLTNTPGANENSAVFSPDGTKIAFSTDRDGNPEIYLMNADGSNQTRLTNNAGNDTDPNWSPDGTQIVFAEVFVGEIFVMNADGSGQTNLTNNGGFPYERFPAWSPDGTKIAYSRIGPGDQLNEIYVMDANGSNPTNLTNSPPNDFKPDWQPLLLPFAAFAAKAEIVLGPLANDDQFEVKATFTLGAGSNGIDPLTEAVSLQVGTFSTTIPAGSFAQKKPGLFKFEGVIGGVALEAEIRALGGGSFQLKAEGANADLTGTVNPVAVGLTIGNDAGATTVTAEIV